MDWDDACNLARVRQLAIAAEIRAPIPFLSPR